MREIIINLCYLAASVLFILGLKGLTHPRTAVRGNFLGALGMLLAVVVTLWSREIVSFEIILAGLVLGSAIGALLALRIEMTAMPQLVALFNGFGGIASALVAGTALMEAAIRYAGTASAAGSPMLQMTVATVLSGIIGAVTLTGSLVAFGKLQELLSSGAVLFPGRHVVNVLLACVCIALGTLIVLDPMNTTLYWYLVGAASLLGILLVLPIGGADMPVVIALLNSYSGVAAAATGFVLNNNGLIISGSLVGASGLILTKIMCKAMNRSLANVVFGGMGAATEGTRADDVYAGKIKSTSAEEIAMLLDGVRRVVFAPGYGLAVAQAQNAVRDMTQILEQRGVEVEFAIHPVAGRMPGHMNVLLAEANISYDKLKDLDDINPTFPETDVVFVVGANDVVNPSARLDPKSPIAGMPVLDVDKARTVVVLKRSLSPGFAGIPNPLFAADNTLMYFADGRKGLLDIVAALKEG